MIRLEELATSSFDTQRDTDWVVSEQQMKFEKIGQEKQFYLS